MAVFQSLVKMSSSRVMFMIFAVIGKVLLSVAFSTSVLMKSLLHDFVCVFIIIFFTSLVVNLLNFHVLQCIVMSLGS